MTMAGYIAADLRRRLGGRQPPPPLTLQALAAEYEVSLTPVRAAIRQLLAEGLLQRRNNGRLSIGRRRPPRPRGAAPLPDRPSVLSQTLQRQAAADVVAHSLRGQACFLREEEAAARYGVGRTALRQAFHRLAGQGLLEHVPRHGWQVRPFDERDMLAYLEVRETLERQALALAYPRLERPRLEVILAGNLPRPPAERLDNSLHRYWIELSGNRYIAAFFAQHGVYYTALFDQAALDAHVVAEMAAQHRAILEALLAERLPAAQEALSVHIRSQAPVVRKLLAQVQQAAE